MAIQGAVPGEAWISAGDTTAYTDPATTFAHSTTPYVRLDGVVVADDWADLTDGTLDAPINIDEFGNLGGQDPEIGFSAYTARTKEDGTAQFFNSRAGLSIPDCGDWTLADSVTVGGLGFPGSTDHQWTNYTDAGDVPGFPCDIKRLLYCFEQ